MTVSVDQEFIQIIQSMIPLLMVRQNLGINPVYLAMIVPVYRLFLQVYTYVANYLTAKEKEEKVQNCVVAISFDDYDIYRSVIDYITEYYRKEKKDLIDGRIISSSALARKHANIDRLYGATYVPKDKEEGLILHLWSGAGSINVVFEGETLQISIREKETSKDRPDLVLKESALLVHGRTSEILNKFVIHAFLLREEAVDKISYKYRKYTRMVKGNGSRNSEPLMYSINIRKNFDNTFLHPREIAAIKKPLDAFLSDDSVKLYERMGWPRKLGYLFYGIPGTGKTSLAYTIAEYAKKQLVIVGSDEMSSSINYLRDVSNRVILFDDIDCFSGIKRKHNPEAEGEPKSDTENKDHKSWHAGYNNNQFSQFLEILDGYNCLHECIVIFTTNYPEKIGDALLRPGRIDHKVCIETTTPEAIRKAFAATFNRNVLKGIKNSQLNCSFTMAHVTNVILRSNMNDVDHAIKLITTQTQTNEIKCFKEK